MRIKGITIPLKSGSLNLLFDTGVLLYCFIEAFGRAFQLYTFTKAEKLSKKHDSVHVDVRF
jgi:hypothetical protein